MFGEVACAREDRLRRDVCTRLSNLVRKPERIARAHGVSDQIDSCPSGGPLIRAFDDLSVNALVAQRDRARQPA